MVRRFNAEIVGTLFCQLERNLERKHPGWYTYPIGGALDVLLCLLASTCERCIVNLVMLHDHVLPIYSVRVFLCFKLAAQHFRLR